MLSPQEDAYGQCMYQHFRGDHPAEVVERDDGWVQSNVWITDTYFAKFKDWLADERQAMRFVRGRVLDIGCGAGRVALHLQSRSHDVVSVDSSPLAIKVCRLRGVKNAKILSITQLTRKLGEFDTLVMFGTFGLFANPRRARWLLKRFHTMTSPQARIIAETSNPYHRAAPPEHREYGRLNRQRGRMPGQLRIRVRYRFACTPWFDYLIVSPREMKSILKGTGWHVTRILNSNDPPGNYVAVIEKAK